MQYVFTVAKTGALALLIVLGLTLAANREAVAANTADWWGGITQTAGFEKLHGWLPSAALVAVMLVGGAMVGSLFSADAWNNVTFTAGEVRNPRRNLPLSLALGTGLVIVLYFLANVVYVVSLPTLGDPRLHPRMQLLGKVAEELERSGQKEEAERIRKEMQNTLQECTTYQRGIAYAADDRVGTAVMELVAPGAGVGIMAVAIMASTFGCANGLILAGARLTYAMSRDGLFFRAVGRLNRHGVPAVGLLLQGVWACLLVFSGTYGQLLDYIIFAALLFYALTVGGLFVLRYRRPGAERPYRAVGYPLLPGLYVLLCAAVALDLLFVKPLYTWPGLIIVLTGIPVYFFWRRGTWLTLR